MTTTLQDRTAIIYGGGGSLGTAVGAALARDGARVVLAGRTRATLEAAAAPIGAEIAVLDALDEGAVDAHVSSLGRVDISMNLVSRGDVQGRPLVDLSVDEVLRAPTAGLRSNFLTARAEARVMTAQGSGVIMHLNSGSGAGAAPGMGSTGPADAAIEAFYRYLAAETGRAGVRVCGIWTAGVAETLTDEKIGAVAGGGPSADQAREMIASMSVLGRCPSVADVAETAAFLASDRAAGITGSMTNVSAGLVLR